MRQDLVERARRGDREAFGQLASGEVDRLHAIARLVLRDPDLAEDAVQEALLKAWRDLPKLREPAKFGAWLRKLVVNSAHDEGRRLKRRRPETELKPHHDRAAGDELDGLLQRDEIARAFRRLKEGERTVIALRYYVELSNADAAATLGIREVAYRSKLHRALRALSAALAADARGTANPQGGWT